MSQVFIDMFKFQPPSKHIKALLFQFQRICFCEDFKHSKSLKSLQTAPVFLVIRPTCLTSNNELSELSEKEKKHFGNSWRNSRKWKKHWRVHSTWIANPHLCMSFLPFLSARSSTLAFLPACKAWRWSLGAKKPSFYLLLFKCNLGMEFWDGCIYIYIWRLDIWWLGDEMSERFHICPPPECGQDKQNPIQTLSEQPEQIACIAIEGCWRVLWNAATAMIAAAIRLPYLSSFSNGWIPPLP